MKSKIIVCNGCSKQVPWRESKQLTIQIFVVLGGFRCVMIAGEKYTKK